MQDGLLAIRSVWETQVVGCYTTFENTLHTLGKNL
jgi:hypothetical protein